jgi:hypothetical protein
MISTLYPTRRSMMNAQLSSTFHGASSGTLRTLRAGRVLPLGATGGKLEVLHGRVWLTRAGDLDDHVVDFGHSIDVPASGRILVESIVDDQPALIAWRAAPLGARVGARLRQAFGRCWEIVDPARRIGVGAAAAARALVVGALLFGPLSDARTRSLAGPALLHNSGVRHAPVAADAGVTPRGPRADAGVHPRERARSATQEARRGAPGVA